MNTEATARRARTATALAAVGLPLADYGTIDGDLVVLPPESVVLRRAVALLVVAMDGTGPRGKLYPLIADYDLNDHFSDREWTFLQGEQSDDERFDFGWRYESAAVMLWALGLFDMTSLPRAQAQPFDVTMALLNPDRNASEAARMRPKADILNAADLHLACAQALLGVAPVPEASSVLDHGVTLERYRAFMWLLHGGDWDQAGR